MNYFNKEMNSLSFLKIEKLKINILLHNLMSKIDIDFF